VISEIGLTRVVIICKNCRYARAEMIFDTVEMDFLGAETGLFSFNFMPMIMDTSKIQLAAVCNV
jgi:hypothetical protein